jgi:HEAT repeat protein
MNTYLRTVLCGGLVLLAATVGFAGEDAKIKGKPLSKWLSQLRSANRGLQVRAARALAEAPKELHEKIIPKVTPILGSDRKNDRAFAAQVLGAYGPAARAAVPHLLPLLKDGQFERNRTSAAEALGYILADAKPDKEVDGAVAALLSVFDDLYVDVRREAVEACGRIGLAAKACIPHLPDRLEDVKHHAVGNGDANKDVHAAAAWTAGRMGKLSAKHIDLLIAMMHRESRNHRVSERVVTAVGLIGAVHKNVVPNVLDSLERVIAEGSYGPIPYRIELVKAHFATLMRFEAKDLAVAVGPMVGHLKKSGPRYDFIAIEAMEVLAKIGKPAAAKAVPVIEKQFASSKKPEVKKAAEAALAALKKE